MELAPLLIGVCCTDLWIQRNYSYHSKQTIYSERWLMLRGREINRQTVFKGRIRKADVTCKSCSASVQLVPISSGPKKPNEEKQILLATPFGNTKAEKDRPKQVARISLQRTKIQEMLTECNPILIIKPPAGLSGAGIEDQGRHT